MINTAKREALQDTDGLKVYTNTKEYTYSTKELRSLFKNEVVIIPYTIYYKSVKSRLPESYIKILDDYKKLTYEINLFKKHSSKCYDKNLVSYIKKSYKYRDDLKKLHLHLYDFKDNVWVLKPQYKKLFNIYNDDGSEKSSKEREYIHKDYINHPLYSRTIKYYEDLNARNKIRESYKKLDEQILKICKELWLQNYEKNHKRINTVARDRFWTLARGLVKYTINQLYTMDIIENMPELIDEALGRVYEGLMCFFDSNYKIDTFIYSCTMSKISAYERVRVKKEDAPELFHNLDDVEMVHTYYGLDNPKLKPILNFSENLFISRHRNWNTAIKELILYE